jgi:hypothetical protein
MLTVPVVLSSSGSTDGSEKSFQASADELNSEYPSFPLKTTAV